MDKNKKFARVALNPFKYLSISVRTEVWLIFSVLCVQIVALFLTKSNSALFVIFSCVIASVLADLFSFKKDLKDPFFWLCAVIRGILTGFFLPDSYPCGVAFGIVFSVMFVNRAVLGGFANSWVNPVAASVACAWLIGLGYFAPFLVDSDIFSQRNPSLALISDGAIKQIASDAKITAFLNESIFARLGVSIPTGYVSLLVDSGASIPAFRFNLLTLFSTLILFASGAMGRIIFGISFVLYALLVRFILPFVNSSPIFQGDVILAIFSSGFLFGTTFLLQWHGTVPLTNRGKIIYGVFAGLIEFVFLGAGMMSIGFIFTILVLNVISPLIQTVENHYERRHALESPKEDLEEGSA